MSFDTASDNSECKLARPRPPQVVDGASIHRLVRDSAILDVNSCYSYLLLCRDFSETCRVAEIDGQLAAMATGYIPPRRPDVLFVWQIAVAADYRRRGLARQLLLDLLASVACRQVRYLEATVAPSNEASRKLFARLAEELEAPFVVEDGFRQEDFGHDSHEAEQVVRVGPIPEKK
ncbi:MAG: diaminobutyrate acetyltransferase [Pirellulales bacterium]